MYMVFTVQHRSVWTVVAVDLSHFYKPSVVMKVGSKATQNDCITTVEAKPSIDSFGSDALM